MSQSRDLQGREGGPCGSRSQHESGLAGEPGELLKIPEGSPWVMLGLGTGRRRGREGWLTSIPLRRKSFWTAEGPAGREAGGDQQGKSRNQCGEWVGSGVPQADQNGSYLPPQQHFLDDPKYSSDEDLPSKLEAFKSEEGWEWREAGGRGLRGSWLTVVEEGSCLQEPPSPAPS